MRRNYRTPRLMAEINITPFTDVILVLLIIFMTTTPLIFQSSIKVNLPEAATKDSTDDSRPVHISISSEGVIYLGKEVVTSKELKQEIALLLKKDKSLNVILFSDQSVRFKDVVGVMDILTALGVKKLNIATKTSP